MPSEDPERQHKTKLLTPVVEAKVATFPQWSSRYPAIPSTYQAVSNWMFGLLNVALLLALFQVMFIENRHMALQNLIIKALVIIIIFSFSCRGRVGKAKRRKERRTSEPR